jgi:hypothetical protein
VNFKGQHGKNGFHQTFAMDPYDEWKTFEPRNVYNFNEQLLKKENTIFLMY